MEDTNLNFGAIKDSILRTSSKEMINEGESKTVKDFKEQISKRPSLQKQYYIYKNIEKTKPFSKERLAERFLKQNLELVKGLNWEEDIIKENKKIRNNMISHEDVRPYDDKKQLFEDVHTLIEASTKEEFYDIQKEQEAYERVIDHLMTNKEDDKDNIQEEENKEKSDEPNEPWEYITKIAADNFNERYEHLNETEKKIFNILISDNNKKSNFLKDTIEESNNILGKIKNDENYKEHSEMMEDFSKKLKRIDENDTTNLDENILYCVELKETLEELNKNEDK